MKKPRMCEDVCLCKRLTYDKNFKTNSTNVKRLLLAQKAFRILQPKPLSEADSNQTICSDMEARMLFQPHGLNSKKVVPRRVKYVKLWAKFSPRKLSIDFIYLSINKAQGRVA